MSNNDDDDDHNDDDDHRDDGPGDDDNAGKPKKLSPRNGDYPVGYKRPPAHTQFKPGQSGNPRGRGNGIKSIKTLLDEHLRRRVPASVDGKRQRISKGEALVVQTLNKAINDPKIGLAFMQQLMRGEGSGEQSKGSVPLPSGPEHDRIIEEFLRAVRASGDPDAGAPDRDDDEGGPRGDA